MTRSVLLLTASAAPLLLLAAVLLWMGLGLSVEEIARSRHSGYIVEA